MRYLKKSQRSTSQVNADVPTSPSGARDTLRINHTVSVVVPAKNEAKNLPFVLPRIPPWVHEVILVDGNSTDDTVAVARRLMPSIHIIGHERKGKGNALMAGFAAATGDIIVMIDADGSTDPAEIPAFVGALFAGAQYAKGTRFMQGGGTADMEFHRKLGNMAFVMLVKILFGGSYSDLCYGYNAFWRTTLNPLQLNCDGFEVETMLNVRALKAGLRIAEVPSFEYKRIYGTSNLHAIRDGLRVLRIIFTEWVSQPLRPSRHALAQTTHLTVFGKQLPNRM
jgi:glycosyltransferase involved in cell wall biosynthesis